MSRTTHGLRTGNKTPPEYSVWRNTIRRCYGNVQGSDLYKANGITVCDRWRFGEGDLTGVECFISDMGPRPSPKHSVDRIDNNGPYSPDNCRWATPKQQQRNKSDNRHVVFRGREMVLAEAIELSGIQPRLARLRVWRGWDVEAALTKPARNYR